MQYEIDESWGEIWKQEHWLRWLQFEEDCSRQPVQRHRKNDWRWRCGSEVGRTLAFPSIITFVNICGRSAKIWDGLEMTASDGLCTSVEPSCIWSCAQLVVSEVDTVAAERGLESLIDQQVKSLEYLSVTGFARFLFWLKIQDCST